MNASVWPVSCDGSDMQALGSVFFKGIVFIATQQPVNFKHTSREIWISDPAHVEARINGPEVQIRSMKADHPFFVSGISRAGWELSDPQSILSTSAANLRALEKCPQAPLEIAPSGGLEFAGDAPDFQQKVSSCGFDDLKLKEGSPLQQVSGWQEGERKLLESGIEILRARWMNGKRSLLVKTKNLGRVQKVLGAGSAFYAVESRDSPAAPGRTVQFQLTLFEVSRSRALKLGVNWPKQVSYKELLEKNRFANGLVADFAESLGIGKILAQPMLRTLPGEKVVFQNGGEFPIEIKTEKEFSTVFKSYGLTIEITPGKDLIPGESEISVEFKAELSEPDFGLSAGKSPGLIKRLLSSRFDLRMDETTILGSMFQSRSSASRSGVSGLVDIPVLKWFVSSKDRNTNDTDLWFGIRPSWIDEQTIPDTEQSDESIRNL